MVEISTSILSVDKEKAVQTFFDLEVAKTDYFHIDVMDGKFVEANTDEIMFENCKCIKNISSIPLEVHLMVENVKEYIEKYSIIEPNIIIFHLESVKREEVKSIIKSIKEKNSRVGISIKPNTPISEIYEFLPYIHLVLIMTVEPGKGGQKIIDSTFEKVEGLKKYVDEKSFDIDIEVDGGINTSNVNKLKEAGANIIVAGNSIIGSNNYGEAIKTLKKI